MDFRFTEEQRFIRDSARAFLAERFPSRRLHEAANSGMCDEALWQGMASEMGWLGVALPESVGGAGLGAVELAILMQETGRVLAAVPYFTTAGLCAPAILAVATAAQQETLLPGLAAGKLRAAFCLTGGSGRPAPQDFPVMAGGPGAWRLDWTAHFVACGGVSDLLLVAARLPGSSGWDGITLIALPTATQGIVATSETSLDMTRPHATIRFALPVPDDALLGDIGGAGPALRRSLAISASLLAAEQLGGAERALEMSVAYAGQRSQFGRVIGSFQAIKHMLADMMVQVESARSAVYYAACAADELPDELEEASAIARSHCSDAFTHCAGQTIQVHGGIGFTWEHDAHLFFKRARSSATLLGSPDHHRDLLAGLIGLDQATPLETTA